MLFWDDSAANVAQARACGWQAEVYRSFDDFRPVLDRYLTADRASSSPIRLLNTKHPSASRAAMTRKEPVMTAIQGLFETHLTVRDLERSLAFYRDRLGLTVAHRVPARDAAFLWLGAPGRAMLGLWGVGSAPLGLQLHLAFAVALNDAVAAPARLRAQGITPLSFVGEPTDEPVVLGWMPAAAVYFNDPDGHSLEYLAMLPGPAHPEAGVTPYREWLTRYGQPGGA